MKKIIAIIAILSAMLTGCAGNVKEVVFADGKYYKKPNQLYGYFYKFQDCKFDTINKQSIHFDNVALRFEGKQVFILNIEKTNSDSTIVWGDVFGRKCRVVLKEKPQTR